MKIFAAALTFLLLSVPAEAIEIFLNENRSETGTIGFIDLDQVFRSYSGTVSSKHDLDEEIRKKEENIDKKRKKIFEQKAEAAKLRQERELAAILPEMMEARRKADEAAEKLRLDAAKIREDEETLKKQEKENEKRKAMAELRQQGVPEEDLQKIIRERFPESNENQEKKDIPLTEAEKANNKEKGGGTGPGKEIIGPDISGSEGNKKAEKDNFSLENETASNEIAAHEGNAKEIDAHESVPLPQLPQSPYGKAAEEAKKAPVFTVNIPGIGDFGFSISTESAKIETAIHTLEQKIKRNEEELKEYEKQAEQELAAYEEARTKQVLGKIYTALKKISEQEEISVVVDKREILYGKKTVDLTQKLLSLLETAEDEE